MINFDCSTNEKLVDVGLQIMASKLKTGSVTTALNDFDAWLLNEYNVGKVQQYDLASTAADLVTIALGFSAGLKPVKPNDSLVKEALRAIHNKTDEELNTLKEYQLSFPITLIKAFELGSNPNRAEVYVEAARHLGEFMKKNGISTNLNAVLTNEGNKTDNSRGNGSTSPSYRFA